MWSINTHRNPFCGLVTFVAVVLVACLPGKAAASDISIEKINELSDQILIKDLELFQNGIAIKLYSDKWRIWRDRRWFLYSLANSSLTSVGAFMAGIGRLRYVNQPIKAPQSLFENATIIRVTANALSLCGSLLEFGLDAADHRNDRRKQIDEEAKAKRVFELNRQIADLIAQRQIAVDGLTQTSKHEQYKSEGAVLSDLQIAAVEDFSAYYDESKGKQAKRFTRLFLVGTSNLVSGAGSLYSGIIVPHEYKGDALKRTRYGGVGGITDIATGSLNIATPILSTVADMTQRAESKAALFRQLGGLHADEVYHLKHHEQVVLSIINNNKSEIDERFLYRRKVIDMILEILEKHQQSNEAARRVALRNFTLSILDSGVDASGSFSKIVNGVGTTVGAYRYTDNARKRFQVTGRAGITYGIGNAIGAGEVVRDEVTREWLHYKHKRQNSLLSQQLEEEWKQLDSAKTRLQN